MFADHHTVSAAALIAVLSGGAVEAMPLSHFPSTYPDTWTVNGKSVFPQFIIGGTDAKKGQYKFYTAYETKQGSQFCGASLVNELWALTAAHCTGGSDNRVRVSAYTFKYEPKTEEIRSLTQEVDHPEYNQNIFSYDIAMLTWAEAIDKVQPVPLFNADTFKKKASPLTVVGLGNTDTSGPFKPPSVLQQVVVDFVTDADCAKAYGSQFKADSMLCAAASGKDSCQGDSGGPIFFTDNSVEKQVGVVSWGYGCADAEFPGVYASVNENVLGFIEKEIDQRLIEQLKKAIQ